jgi:hypothetical protein
VLSRIIGQLMHPVGVYPSPGEKTRVRGDLEGELNAPDQEMFVPTASATMAAISFRALLVCFTTEKTGDLPTGGPFT